MNDEQNEQNIPALVPLEDNQNITPIKKWQIKSWQITLLGIIVIISVAPFLLLYSFFLINKNTNTKKPIEYSENCVKNCLAVSEKNKPTTMNGNLVNILKERRILNNQETDDIYLYNLNTKAKILLTNSLAYRPCADSYDNNLVYTELSF